MMIWTSEKPISAGINWCWDDLDAPQVCEIAATNEYRLYVWSIGTEDPIPLASFNIALWAGPLERPAPDVRQTSVK